LTILYRNGLYSWHRRRLGLNLEALAGRCVFSESLNRQTLGFDAGGPPGLAGPNRVNGWRAVARVLRSPLCAFDDVVTTFFPADCRCCEGPLLRAGLVPVCDACVGRVRQSTLTACARCGEALGIDLDMEDLRFAGQMAASLRCRECRMAEPGFEQAVSFGTYEGELRSLIQLMKFDGVRSLAGTLGDRLADAVAQLEGVAANELLVVAVPLFAARERQRGYNQSVLLADRALARLRKIRPEWRLVASHKTLRRVRQTEAQYVLTLRERRRNLRGAFVVDGEVAGREVLVVDDILTSGATARECARVLKAAGAARVWIATLARAQKQEFARLHEDPGDDVARWDAAAVGQA
jgi:ComF family protein